jgi:hypothetical protein
MNLDELQGQIRLEIERRMGMLHADADTWTTPARIQKMGLSGSQLVALKDMVEVLEARQQLAFSKLNTGAPAVAFGNGNAEMLVEMTGAHELWSTFRTILAQYEDAQLLRAVQAGARVAGDCYTLIIRQARSFQAIATDCFRETPLVFLEAVDSPATASRGSKAQLLNASIRQLRNLKLPLPIVLLPFDYAGCIWTFCGLHHEVGHNADQDLELLPELRGTLPDIVPPEQEPDWRRWSGEILADAFGIVLGGAGFAASLAAIALALGPGDRFQQLDKDAVHPPFLVRVRVLIEMLKGTGVAGHLDWASKLQGIWDLEDKPGWVGPFSDSAGEVAKLFLMQKLATLKDHTLVELNPQMEADHHRTEQLARFFLGQGPRPDPQHAEMHPRLVPCAAQLAIRLAQQLTPELLADLQKTALDYLDLVPPVATLGAPVGRRDYLKQLVHGINFETM